MSLSVCVGQLAHCIALKDRAAVRESRRDLKRINQELKGRGLPEHHEPEEVPGGKAWSCRIAGDYLTPLRRLAAHVRLRLVRDEEEEFDEWPAPWDAVWYVGYEDPYLDEYYTDASELFDHLMYHSDYQGYYVPIDFYEPLYPSGELFDQLGGQIGSTQGLLRDCEEVAKMIGLPTYLDADSKCFFDAVASAAKLGQGWWRYPTECERCLKMIAACRKSLEWGSIIEFHG
jgi:hypothetical protein